MALAETLRFFRSYLREPEVIGAVVPSSPRLAAALVRPLADARRRARVLEIGAGTGGITRRIVRAIRPDDQLDICELKNELADVIESTVLARPHLRQACRAGRVRLLRCAAQDIDDADGYDFIICGLPFTAFEPAVVSEILASVRRNLRPDGVFSYFEYVGLRRLNRSLGIGNGRERVRRVSAIMDRHIERHQFRRETVLFNLPPAHARHWRFAPR